MATIPGRDPPGKTKDPVTDKGAALAAEDAWEGAQRLIARYDDPATAYVSRTAPQFVKTYASDYDHLARVFEWMSAGEAE